MKISQILAFGLSFCILGGFSFYPAKDLLAGINLHVRATEVVLQHATRVGDECMKLQVESINAVPGGYADVYITPYSHNNLEKLDFTVSWEDTS